VKPINAPYWICALFILLAPTSHAEIKNVLVLISDDLRANTLGCYGDKFCDTPNIDKLASRGMLFERAYCQGTWCAPSRISFMHSRYQGSDNITLGQHFKGEGFYSARVGKIFHMRVPGDIIAGTDGNDVPACWTERFNSPGQEAHTPGDYACLNRNIFTEKLEGRPEPVFQTLPLGVDGRTGGSLPDAL
jgi:iduronate 2-sulfatase